MDMDIESNVVQRHHFYTWPQMSSIFDPSSGYSTVDDASQVYTPLKICKISRKKNLQ
jgi:hypothetical protein